MSTQVTKKIISSCDGGPCPAIWETDDPDMFGVQGAFPENLAEIPDVPGHETVVLVPRAILERWAAQQP